MWINRAGNKCTTPPRSDPHDPRPYLVVGAFAEGPWGYSVWINYCPELIMRLARFPLPQPKAMLCISNNWKSKFEPIDHIGKTRIIEMLGWVENQSECAVLNSIHWRAPIRSWNPTLAPIWFRLYRTSSSMTPIQWYSISQFSIIFFSNFQTWRYGHSFTVFRSSQFWLCYTN